MTVQQLLLEYNVTMEQANEFIMGNLNNIQYIYDVCKQIGITNDMISEILNLDGITGTDVANYFASNGIDSNDLGGSTRTIDLPLPSGNINEQAVFGDASDSEIALNSVISGYLDCIPYGENDEYIFTAEQNGTVTATLTGLSADADLEMGEHTSFTMIQKAYSYNSGNASESASMSVTAGETYAVHVIGYFEESTNYQLSISIA